VLGRLELQPQHRKGKSDTEVFASEARGPRMRHLQNASQKWPATDGFCTLPHGGTNGHIFAPSLLRRLDALFKALASYNRYRILNVLQRGEVSPSRKSRILRRRSEGGGPLRKSASGIDHVMSSNGSHALWVSACVCTSPVSCKLPR
jgi:hypothetical protein